MSDVTEQNLNRTLNSVMEKAYNLLKQGEFAAAKEICEKILDKAPLFQDAYKLKALINQSEKKAQRLLGPPVLYDELSSFYASSLIGNLDIGRGCNLRCLYCSSTWKDDHNQIYFVPDEKLEKDVELFKALGIKLVRLWASGETTVKKNWVNAVNFLHDADITIYMMSNLAKEFSDEEIEALSKISILSLSLDTFDAEKTSRIRRGLKLERFIENVKAVRRLSPYPNGAHIKINSVATVDTIFDFADMVEKGIELGVNAFSLCSLLVLKDKPVAPISDLSDEDKKKALAVIEKAKELCRQNKRRITIDVGIEQTLSGDVKPAEEEKPDTYDDVYGISAMDDYSEVSFEPLKEGETRMCLAPWYSIIVTNNNTLNVCCEVQDLPMPEGLDAQGVINEIKEGVLTKIRKGLLTGNPVGNCRRCRLKHACKKEDLQELIARCSVFPN